MSRLKKEHILTASTPAKNRIREDIDRALIERFRDELFPDQKLTYLGLPGAELLDILSWREFLISCTAVEDSSATDILELNIMKNRLEGLVRAVYADINELLSTPEGQGRLQWPYQIINLDYAGGLVYQKADKTSRKLNALKGLFLRQAGNPFLLFLTLNLRDKDKGELAELVAQQEADLRLVDPEGVKACFEQHRSLGHAGLLKLYVPIFLLNEAMRYELPFLPPILYRGTRQMIHFAVECRPFTLLSAGRVLTNGDRIAEINQPLLVLDGSEDLRSVDLGKIDWTES